MRQRLLFVVIAALTIAGCRKEPEPDIYIMFKVDDTPRWESGSIKERNDSSSYVFITDSGGKLFGSENYKTGRMKIDGSSYEIIEFGGTIPVVGKPAEAIIHKPTETKPIPLYSLEIVQIKGDVLWIVFKETATSPERRVVQ